MITYRVITTNNNDRFWFYNGNRHREDGPAVEFVNGKKLWYLNGKLHREDGPAVEYASGSKSWYIKGKRLTEKEFSARTSVREMTVAEIEALVGQRVKIVAG